MLSNGALGPDMTLDAVGQSTIEVVGYDTNYGTIEATHDPSTAGGSFLAFTIQPNSQLNNEGTISADSTVSAATGSRSASLDFENGASRTPAVLNNDGQINILNDSTASITTTTIGTGAITLARTDGAETNAYPNLTFSEGQVAASQSVALEAGQMTLYQDLGAA